MAGACGDIQPTLVAVIQNPEQGGAEIIAAAADVIAADARFNLWVFRVGKKQKIRSAWWNWLSCMRTLPRSAVLA
jgi:hypothetical protein